MANVTKELQEALKMDEKIKEVFFDDKGDFHFHKHKVLVHSHKDGISTGAKEVEALPGSKRSILKIKSKDGRKVIDKQVNVSFTPIAEVMTREQVLSAKVSGLTMEQEESILAQAEAIKLQRAGKKETKKDK